MKLTLGKGLGYALKMPNHWIVDAERYDKTSLLITNSVNKEPHEFVYQKKWIYRGSQRKEKIL